jgi:hypothetical protein
MVTGFAGYGVSLVLFVVALRNLGTARTGAYFSVAPIFGVALSLFLWPEVPSLSFWIAAVLMALGIWLHIRERHVHPHTHEVWTITIDTGTTSTINTRTILSGTGRNLIHTRISTRLLLILTCISLIFTTAISIDAPNTGTGDAV